MAYHHEFLKSFYFIHFEREREGERERERACMHVQTYMCEGRGREGERESQAGCALSAQSQMQGSNSQIVKY